ncbi:hypothetical protein EV361DRAFT_954673 [Lentinula raphanica]|nr:hypothetical protein EV361DRAFT_954673 [Lentinula raphanica]
MLLSRSTSVIFLAAVGMITVLSLPVPDEHNLFPSLPATNAQAPAVQEISKRMDASQSGSSLTNPTAQKRPLPEDAAAGSSEPPPKVAKTAKDLPPGAYPPIFKWKGGRKFNIAEDYKEKFRTVEQWIDEDIEAKIGALLDYWIPDETARIRFRENRVKPLQRKLVQLRKEPDFSRNEEFVQNMKRLNCLHLMFNDDKYEQVKLQAEWIMGKVKNMKSLTTENKRKMENLGDRVSKRTPKFDDLYLLGLAGKDYFGVSYLTEAYVEKRRQ